MAGHTTNRTFDCYLQLEGKSLKKLHARRKSIAANGLTMDVLKSEEIKY